MNKELAVNMPIGLSFLGVVNWLAHVAAIRHMTKVVVFPILLAFCLALIGCDGTPKASVPNVSPSPYISYSNPGEEPIKCACQNSTAAYLNNPTSTQRKIKWKIYTKNIDTGLIAQPTPGEITMNAGAPAVFLGCTIHAPTTNCRFQDAFRISNDVSVMSNTSSAEAIYGAVSSPSIATCKAWCSDPNSPNSSACLPLGVRYFSAVAPFSEMVKLAQSKGGTVKKPDVLKLYGLKESDDTCGRGDITTVNGLIVNKGSSEACVIKSTDLPTAVVAALKLPGITGVRPLEMLTVLPPTVEATAVGSIKSLNATEVVTFQDKETAPYFTFDGAGGAALSKDFGGTILGSARISESGRPPQTVIATSNGCIAVDEK